MITAGFAPSRRDESLSWRGSWRYPAPTTRRIRCRNAVLKRFRASQLTHHWTMGPQQQRSGVSWDRPFEGDDEEGRSIHFYPDTGELDLRFWHETLAGHADWDVWNDVLTTSDDELERRLRVLGAAITADSST